MGKKRRAVGPTSDRVFPTKKNDNEGRESDYIRRQLVKESEIKRGKGKRTVGGEAHGYMAQRNMGEASDPGYYEL